VEERKVVVKHVVRMEEFFAVLRLEYADNPCCGVTGDIHVEENVACPKFIIMLKC
jgi:hypothetical protein